MNSLYEKDNLLPYVTEQQVAVPPKSNIFKPKLNRNGLSTAAFICAISSVVLGILLVPSILGIALGVGALIIAVKRGLSKKMPIISIVISAVTMILSTIGLLFVIFVATPESEPYIPAAYTYDEPSGIAYKYNPITNIPCDDSGVCSFEVTLFSIDSQKCPNGGTFNPQMQDLITKSEVPSEIFPFQASTNGAEQVLPITLYSTSNTRLIEAVASRPIICK